MHIASSDIENSDSKMVPIQGNTNHFDSVRSPAIDGIIPATKNAPM